MPKKIKNNVLFASLILFFIIVIGFVKLADLSKIISQPLPIDQKNDKPSTKELLQGCWTNEGDVLEQTAKIEVDLEIGNAKEVKGALNSYDYKDETEWDAISLEGEYEGTNLRIHAIKISQGDSMKWGDFTIEYTKNEYNEELLHWITIDSKPYENYIPKETYLRKCSN